ncbi:DUF294 nucleotidyltransferase-like domain-containing protein [Alkalihalobacillus sp. NPDC078783]
MTGQPIHDDYNKWQRRLDELYRNRLADMEQLDLTVENLHGLHEKLMRETIQVAIEKTESERGKVPARFTFFVMGSAGRAEQLQWSDQDHAIIFEQEDAANKKENQSYFLSLGEEIVEALECVGYERCDGNVMASNLKWCKSREDFRQQLLGWLREDTWEHMRYVLTFFDGRAILGPEHFLSELKESIFNEVTQNKQLLQRFKNNTGRMRNGIGLFGQLLTETEGDHKGTFDLKQLALFPYVNGLRLLAIQEEITSPQTLKRFEELPDQHSDIQNYQASYRRLLEKRIAWQSPIQSYDDIHHVNVNQLDTHDKKQLKEWIKEGRELYHMVEKIVGSSHSL